MADDANKPAAPESFVKRFWSRLTSKKKPTETALVHRVIGLGIGLLMILLVITWKTIPGTATNYRSWQMKAQDILFSIRGWLGKIPEHPKIVNIAIDDGSMRNLRLPFPLPRPRYAQIVNSLNSLGPRSIIMDVMFLQPSEYAGQDEALATAIADARNVILAWPAEFRDLPDEEHRDLYEKIKPIILADLRVDEEGVAKRLGIQPSILQQFQDIRRRVLREYLVDVIRNRAAEAGEVTVEEVVKQCVPHFDADKDEEAVTLISDCLQKAYAMAAIDRTSSFPCTADAAQPEHPIRDITAPHRPFVAGFKQGAVFRTSAAHAGFANDLKDAVDGTLRRVSLINVWRDRAYYHLAFIGVCDALGVTSDRIRIESRHLIEIRPNVKEFPDLPDRIVVPLNDNNEMLVNWAGNGDANQYPFIQVPIGTLIELDTRTTFAGINSVAAFMGLYAIVQQLPAVIPEKDQQLPDELQALIAEEMAVMESKKEEGEPVKLARYRKMRVHTEWMLERIRQWSAKLKAWSEEALKKGEIDPDTANGVKAAAAKAELDVQTSVAPHLEREAIFRKDIEPKIRGAYCIVGAFGTGEDLHSTPLYHPFPGPGVLSNILNMFFTNNFLHDATRRINIAAIIVCGLLIACLVTFAGPVTSTIGTLSSEIVWVGIAQYLFMGHRLVVDVIGPILAIFLSYAFITAYRQLIEGRDKRQVRKMFGLFVSDQVLHELMKNPDTVSLGGQKRVTTVMFSDVSGFTALSEKMDPADQIRFMNVYLTAMSDVIMRHNGYLDKYIGDGIMAVYGAPLVSETHAIDAARTALECLVELKKLNVQLTAEGKPNIKIRIGLSTGEVVAGLVGSLKKLSYTAMGDTVNLGARLEAASKPYKTKILMNDRCYEMCRKEVIARELDLIRVPGKSIPVQVYELLGLEGDGKVGPAGFLEMYNAGLALYKQRKWEESAKIFEQALALNPEDGPAKIYHERATLFMDVPPPDDWDGVATVSVK